MGSLSDRTGRRPPIVGTFVQEAVAVAAAANVLPAFLVALARGPVMQVKFNCR